MNEPSLHDHRREAEEAEDLAKEQDALEARLQFDGWVQNRLGGINEESAQISIESAMAFALSDLYQDIDHAFSVALFHVYATHGEDLAANRRLIDLLDPYMRAAVRELGY